MKFTVVVSVILAVTFAGIFYLSLRGWGSVGQTGGHWYSHAGLVYVESNKSIRKGSATLRNSRMTNGGK